MMVNNRINQNLAQEAISYKAAGTHHPGTSQFASEQPGTVRINFLTNGKLEASLFEGEKKSLPLGRGKR
jgi:hypothetical protein